jgi:hypothetical protein
VAKTYKSYSIDADTLPQKCQEIAQHTKIAEILRCLAFAAYRPVWQHYNGTTPSINTYLERELGIAEDLDGL